RELPLGRARLARREVAAARLQRGDARLADGPAPAGVRRFAELSRPRGALRRGRAAAVAEHRRERPRRHRRPGRRHRLDRALRVLRPELPIFGMLPSVHRAAAYGNVHTARPAAAAAMAAWGARAGVPLLDLEAVVGEHVLSGAGNPDGMHWGWKGHAAVGDA